MTDNIPFADIADGLRKGRFAPFLGAGLLSAYGTPPIPASSRELVDRLVLKVAVPGKLRGNLWSAAQWIESHKHRVTLVRALQALFAEKVEPTPVHRWIAGLDLPLIVDEWYDTAMADALTEAGRPFTQFQGIRRSGQKREEPWVKSYDEAGQEVAEELAAQAPVILYKPHGAARPAANFLVSDSDYVEVLTEIDIQTPIPAEVIARRGQVGFVFLGCRFYDQMQRVFAQSIMKRTAGPHYAVIEGEMSKNEERFLERQDIVRIDMPLRDAAERLMVSAA